MKRLAKKTKPLPMRETLTEAYEVRAFRDDDVAPVIEKDIAAIPHAEPGEFQAIKGKIKGHGEQVVLPDDCQFCDNDLCFVET